MEKTQTTCSTRFPVVSDRILLLKILNFIFVTCIWIKSRIGSAHVQGRDANVLCKRLEKPIDFCVKCSLKSPDLKDIWNCSKNFSQIVHCKILGSFIKRFGSCYIYVHTDGERDFNRHWAGMLGYRRRKLKTYLTSIWLQTIFLNTSYYCITRERTVMFRLFAKHS
jgi:hypothetical protein